MKTEEFRVGVLYLDKEGVMKEKKFPGTRKPPHRWYQWGAVEPQTAMQHQGLRRQNAEKAVEQHYSAHKQVTSLIPEWSVGAGSQEKQLARSILAKKEGAGSQRKWHTSLH